MVFGLGSSNTPQKTNDDMLKRDQRDKCFAARDAFYSCLDANHIENPIKDKHLVDEHCNSQDQEMANQCIQSWVKYYKQKKMVDNAKARKIDKLKQQGAVEIDIKSM